MTSPSLTPETVDLFDRLLQSERDGKAAHVLSIQLQTSLGLTPREFSPIFGSVDPPQWVRHYPELLRRWSVARKEKENR